jgi:serine/threonine protein kinase
MIKHLPVYIGAIQAMPNFRKPCDDEFNNTHYLRKVLAQGGQGIVYRTTDPDVAIKLVIDKNGTEISSEKLIAAYRSKFRQIRLLPIPKEANITFPVALLSETAGYVMTFLEGMYSVSSLCINSNNSSSVKDKEIPVWLSGMSDKNAAKQIVAYYKTGGLRGRLLVLYKIASKLAMLHGAGLVYGDISHNNIFYSNKNDQYSIWLIDADNLKYEGEKGAVYTPRYGAPELVQEKGEGTTASDCHAFAVLAYNMLTMVHPFMGKKVTGQEIDWADTAANDKDPEAEALMGNYPWVGVRDDDSNSSDDGLPPVLLYDNELAELFQRTFGDGRKDPSKRPVIFHWPNAFIRAADSTIQCPGCNMSYRDDMEKCPYCEEPLPAMVVMEAYSWENNTLGKMQWRFVREIGPSGILTFPSRIFSIFPLTESDIPVLEVDIQDSFVLFKKKGENLDIEFSIAARNIEQGRFNKILSQIRIKPSGGIKNISEYFIFASYNGSSRMVLCTIKSGAK